MLRVALAPPLASGLATRAAAAALRLPAVARRAAGTVSGIGLSYPRPRGSHPLVGRRAPDLPLAGGGRLYEALRAGSFVLVSPDPLPPTSGPVVVRPASGTGTTLLVRPDGYVGWAAEHPAPDAVRAAVAVWLADPDPARRSTVGDHCQVTD
jgi:hypothetical protein